MITAVMRGSQRPGGGWGRNVEALLILGVLGALGGETSAAERFPSRPVRVVVAAGVGSGPDIIARQLGIKLTEAWGEQIVVDNRAGASGLIGAEAVAKAAPDGHTLWMATLTQLISTTAYQRF